MKILFISTSDIEGGAAIASFRLFQALKKTGHEVKMLVAKKYSSDKDVIAVDFTPFQLAKYKAQYFFEKIKLSRLLKKRQDVFFFSTGEYGIDISRHPLVLQADIIHYHWVNHAFLSIEVLKKLTALGKPVISHLHDMWAFTGGCHYAGNCNHFSSGCGNCPLLSRAHRSDLSAINNNAKQDLYQTNNLQFVASSNYLKKVADTSLLLASKNTRAFPIPIDTSIYKRKNIVQARKKLGISLDKNILLFGSQNIAHKRKGFQYFADAVNMLANQSNDFKKNVEVAVFGKYNKDLQSYFNIKVNTLGILNLDELNDAYSASDVYVIPSLEDNLPNTVLESLACETPVVAFHTGGIPEMVTHLSNGYLAAHKSVKELADGIMWAISYKPKAKLNEDIYSVESVSSRLSQFYSELLQGKPQQENVFQEQTK